MTHVSTPDPATQEPGDDGSKRSSMPVDPAVGAAAGGVLGVGLLMWLLSRLRLRRRRPQTPSEKLLHVGREASTALGLHASRLTAEAAEAAQKAAAVAAPAVVAGTGLLAKEGMKAGSVAAHAGARAVSAGAHATEELAETLEHAQRRASRMLTKVLAALAFGGGYVLGAQAGRERYDQIVRAADQLRSRVTGSA